MHFESRFRIEPGSKVKLKNRDPSATPGYRSKERAKRRLERNLKAIEKLQYALYAERKQSLLVVLQGMDCAGKSGVIRHVMSCCNPLGLNVTTFKKPTPEELSHDFLWRIHAAVPAQGHISVFDRSHYEDVLVVRVHSLAPWAMRYEQINQFEQLLTVNRTTILKFCLHISKDEQTARLRERFNNTRKNWKFQIGDLAERERWHDYRRAYEGALERCSTKLAPWYLIPADRKWYRNLAISEILRTTLERMNPQLPVFKGDPTKIRI